MDARTNVPAAAAIVAALGCWLAASAAETARAADGDAARGERAFQRCYSCHPVDRNETAQLQGPSLFQVVGRRAASIAGFDYSDAMTAKGAAGLTWAADALDRFIADPEAFVPGTLMALPPVRDAQERADLIAYLAASARR